ncbi:hypothetical protein F2Q69_00025278 [Brassica cretica]|uniref:Uncharacterized protein n=1 Tax=Brassica cretica TaxID=69181 RepID=A0A8S9Q6K1_BRACR|nr:hypothetical protein F2Q69_00025278 [Brassica cretica]
MFFFSTFTFILRQAPPPAQSPTLFLISYFAACLQSIVTRWSFSRRRISSSSTFSIWWLVKLRCAFLCALSSLPTVGKPNRGGKPMTIPEFQNECHNFESRFRVRGRGKLRSSCAYTVIISTSCSSSRYTRDQISVAFGDAYGNQVWFPAQLVSLPIVVSVTFDSMELTVTARGWFFFFLKYMLIYMIYAPRLDDPSTKTFEQCSSDTFEINGPCTYQICYVYLYRSGPDGWIPESVKINTHGSKAVTFPYNTLVPESIWYGFNYCNSASDSSVLSIGLVLLGFVVAGSTLLL